jgi:hypothetical protein
MHVCTMHRTHGWIAGKTKLSRLHLKNGRVKLKLHNKACCLKERYNAFHYRMPKHHQPTDRHSDVQCRYGR